MSDTSYEARAAAKDNLDRTMTGLKNGVAAATSGFEQAQSTMRDGMQKAMKTAQDMITFTQGNVEAVTRSSQILATGVQDMSQSIASTARASADEAVNAFKALITVRSIKDARDLQGNLVRSMLAHMVAQTSQMTGTTMKLSEQAMAPITARLAVATETFGRIA